MNFSLCANMSGFAQTVTFVHVNDIDDIQTCKIYFFNSGFTFANLTDYCQLYMIN